MLINFEEEEAIDLKALLSEMKQTDEEIEKDRRRVCIPLKRTYFIRCGYYGIVKRIYSDD